MNEYKENMKSIESKYNNSSSQIKNVFNQTIKESNEKKLEKERNNEKAKNEYEETMEIEKKRYENKLKIINDWCNEYEIQINNRINNDIEETKKHKKYLEELKDNCSKELATTRSEYNHSTSKIEQISIENIKYAEQTHKQLINDKNKQDINAQSIFEASTSEATNQYQESKESIEIKYNNRIFQIEKVFTETIEELNKKRIQ
eukprot:10994_1